MNKNAVKESLFLGVAAMIISQFFSASVVTAVKVLSKNVQTLTIVFVGYLICLCFITIIMLIRNEFKIKTQHLPLQLARSGVGVLYFGGLFWAVKFIPVVDGVLLRSTAPLWVPFVALILMREKINPKIYWGLCLGFLGIIFVLHPSFINLNVGYLIALLSAICYALSGVITHQLNTLGEPKLRTLFYAFLLPSIVLIPYVMLNWPKTLDFEDVLLLVYVGLGTLLLLLFYVSALSHASATVIVPISYIGVVFAGIFDWIIWNIKPNMLSIAGMVLVFLGCSFIVWIKQKSKIPLELD